MLALPFAAPALAALAVVPWISPPVFRIPGTGLTLYGFGMCVAAAIIVGSLMVKRRVRMLGLSEDHASELLYAVFGGGFVGAHLVDVLFYRPEALARDPLLLLKIWDGISSMGGFLGAAAGVFIFFRWRRTSREAFWGYCEAIIYSLPFGWVFGRLGCALAHDHPGIKSDFFLAVDTPPLDFQRRYGLPDGPFLDLGLLELLYTIAIVVVLLVLDRRRRPVGFYLAVVPAIYAPVRFGLDFLRIRDVRYLGLTPGQYVALSLFALSAILWARRPRDVFAFDGDPPRPVAAPGPGAGA